MQAIAKQNCTYLYRPPCVFSLNFNHVSKFQPRWRFCGELDFLAHVKRDVINGEIIIWQILIHRADLQVSSYECNISSVGAKCTQPQAMRIFMTKRMSIHTSISMLTFVRKHVSHGPYEETEMASVLIGLCFRKELNILKYWCSDN